MPYSQSTARYADADRRKTEGATYTPKPLANFVAKQVIDTYTIPAEGQIRVLDPACGTGELLEAIINNFPSCHRNRLVIRGFDTDPDVIATATIRLRNKYPDLNIKLTEIDFLSYVLNLKGCGDLFSQNETKAPFHLVIANPPYVRTQVMGAEHARQLSQSFNLSGRIDLYYPFILGISDVLDNNGVSGVITSNRFMTTKSGQNVRQEVLTRFNVLKVWDLGDTKLFDAAVLPSVFIAEGTASAPTKVADVEFSSIYQTKESATERYSDPLEALQGDDGTVAEVSDGRCFKVRRGKLANDQDLKGVWRIATTHTDTWLSTVERNTWDTFSRIGKIRVGVKSTADKIFLRSDWDELPSGRPELLKPLITRKCAQRFKAKIPENPKHRKEIIYPHIATPTGRSAVELHLYPKSEAYLKQHKEKLASRKYLIDAGRNWYELWVPQDPSAWSKPKLVFPDISEKPVFWMDESGAVVNGECYWLQCKNSEDKDLLWLALAIGNSSFIEAFYDHKFNNKLYAGKRRFITQYVELFPLPQPDSPEGIAIIQLAKTIYEKTPSPEVEKFRYELEALIWQAFGLEFEKVLR